MAYEIGAFAFTAKAGADLSDKQYHLVKFSADNTVVLCTALTDKPCGVLQDNPTLGQAAQILATGITKVKVDAATALVAGQAIGTTVLGTAVSKVALTDIGCYVVGQVVKGGAAGTVATAMISCAAPVYMPAS